MSDIIAPTIQLNRKPDTGNNEKAAITEQSKLNLSVPNFQAGWLQMGANAFELGDQIKYTIDRTEARNTYNDLRIHMDEMVTNLIDSNGTGRDPATLRTEVFDKLEEYAQKNFLNKGFMQDPRIREEIMKEYNQYVQNTTGTINADNVKKVRNNYIKSTTDTFMMAANDLQTALNTADSDKYLENFRLAHDEMLAAQDIDPNSPRGKASFQEQLSNVYLMNTLQDLEDPGKDPWALERQIKAQKGKMITDHYVKALRAIHAKQDSLEAKALSRKQGDAANFRWWMGTATEEEKFAAAMSQTEKYFKERNIPADPESQEYMDVFNSKKNAIENKMAENRLKFSDGFRNRHTLLTNLNNYAATVPPTEFAAMLDYANNEALKGSIPNYHQAALELMRNKIDPRHASKEQWKAAHESVDIMRGGADPEDLEAMDRTVAYIYQTHKLEQAPPIAQIDKDKLNSIPNEHLLATFQANSGDMNKTAKALGVSDPSLIQVMVDRAYVAQQESTTKQLDTMAFAFANRIYDKVDKSYFNEIWNKDSKNSHAPVGAIKSIILARAQNATQAPDPILKMQFTSPLEFMMSLYNGGMLDSERFRDSIMTEPSMSMYKK